MVMPNSRDRYVRTSFAVAPPRCASTALKTASRSATVGACLRRRALGASGATGAVLAGRPLLRLSIVPGVFPNRVSTRSAISSSLSSFASVALSASSRASCSETRCLSRPISSGVVESFVRSAKAGSFSVAARALALTPAAVSRNVAMLERNLGVRLFHRSTRKLTLTAAGERFLQEIGNNLEGLQNAIAAMATDQGEPAGLLKVSMGLSFGVNYILPLLPEFLGRYPRIRPDWQFDNRRVDLIAEGFDAAIGGGFDLAPAVISRVLAPLHIIAVASPDYMKGRTAPIDPTGLSEFDGIVQRSSLTGRLRHRVMRNAIGAELPAALNETIVVNDPAALSQAAVLSLGVALISVPEALPYLESNALVRLVPSWYGDLGPISLYFATRTLLPAKTRVFVDFVLEAFRRDRLAERFAGSLG
jgi:DNA-binding transcriptional LysR family regulator